MKKIKHFIVLAFIIIASGCNKEENLVTEPNAHFFLKNENGTIVTNIEKEVRKPIYEDLKSLGRIEEAEAFLLTYDTEGNLTTAVKEQKKKNITSKATPPFSYGYHLQNIGWKYGNDYAVNVIPNYYEFGTTGQSRRLEAFYLFLGGVNLCYESHLQSIGWQGNKCNGQVSGTTGQSRRMEAVKISITDGKGFVLYQSHLQNTGWESGWKYNGQVSGTTGQSRRLEAIRIKFYLY